jgi:hypothetical protein
MNKPKLKLKPNLIDNIVEFIGYSALLILIIVPFYYYKILPDFIPIHFSEIGIPDSNTEKYGIFAFPIIGFVLFIGLSIINKYPYLFNYPVEITEDNAEKIYTHTVRTLRLLKVVIVLLFLKLVLSIVNISFGESDGLGSWFLPIFLISIFLPILIMVIQMYRDRK